MMTQKNQKILDKIKALLALANDAGASPNEAATALRQAQKMMEQHGIEQAAVDAPTIGESHIKAGSKCRPSLWELNLTHIVADAFGAVPIFVEHFDKGEWQFIAPTPRAEVAAYVATILLRKLTKARKEYIDTKLTRVKKRANKTARADDFCYGWIAIVQRQVIKLALSEAEQQAVDTYIAANMGKTETVTGRAREGDKRRDRENDFRQGVAAGKDVHLHQGVGADGKPTRAIGRG